jgi:hypothetical protein
VQKVLAGAVGETSMMRGADGSVFVYDDQRGTEVPATVRWHVDPEGYVERSNMRFSKSS